MGRHTSSHDAAEESDAASAVGTAPAFDAAPQAFDAAPQAFDAAPQALGDAGPAQAAFPASAPTTARTAAAPVRSVAARLGDETEVIPRVGAHPVPPPRHQSIWPADSDYAPSEHTAAEYAAGRTAEYRQSEDTGAGATAFAGPGSDPTFSDESGAADATTHRRPWLWAGLAVFWVLALGAGLITLASLGAPHYLCTGSAAKGLACRRTGTVLAGVLTVALVTAVGVVSVLSIEARAERRGAVRWLGLGVVALVVIAGCGYLLIRTIGG